MHFGENQLSRSLIGLSPLPTAHPLSLQPKWVRASTRSYPRFTLAMGRSLRFGSRTCHYTTPCGMDTPYSDSLSLRLPLNGLTSRHVPDSQAHSSKGTPSPDEPALTDCRHTVSGTISLPSRGTFHHSLTVLFRYRSLGSIQAYRVVPADSQQIPRARCYSGTPSTTETVFSPTGLSPATADHPRPLRLTAIFSDCRPDRQIRERQAPQHRTHNPCRVSHARGLAILRVRSPLLTESLFVFSSYGY